MPSFSSLSPASEQDGFASILTHTDRNHRAYGQRSARHVYCQQAHSLSCFVSPLCDACSICIRQALWPKWLRVKHVSKHHIYRHSSMRLLAGRRRLSCCYLLSPGLFARILPHCFVRCTILRLSVRRREHQCGIHSRLQLFLLSFASTRHRLLLSASLHVFFPFELPVPSLCPSLSTDTAASAVWLSVHRLVPAAFPLQDDVPAVHDHRAGLPGGRCGGQHFVRKPQQKADDQSDHQALNTYAATWVAERVKSVAVHC